MMIWFSKTSIRDIGAPGGKGPATAPPAEKGEVAAHRAGPMVIGHGLVAPLHALRRTSASTRRAACRWRPLGSRSAGHNTVHPPREPIGEVLSIRPVATARRRSPLTTVTGSLTTCSPSGNTMKDNTTGDVRVSPSILRKLNNPTVETLAPAGAAGVRCW